MKKLLLLLTFLFGSFSIQAQWVQQSYYAGPILNLKTINSQIAWGTVFNHTGVIRTTDGGANWNATNTASIFSNFAMSISLATRTADTAWYLVQSSPPGKLIYKTTDGGLTWVQQQILTPTGYPFGIHFFDHKNGLVLSSAANGNWDFYTTTNGGATWVSLPLANFPASNRSGTSHTNAFSVYGNTIWFTAKNLTNTMVLLKSMDRGLTWNSTTLPVISTSTRPFPETIAFKDNNNGLFAMDSLLYRTNDGGTTWQPVSYNGPLCSTQIIHVPGTAATYIAVGSSVISKSATRGSAVSYDDGNTWTLLDTDSHMGVSFINPAIGWVGGTNFVYKFNGSPLGISKPNAVAASNFTISPNPGSGIFTISGSQLGSFNIEVYNMVGLKVLQKQSRPFGTAKIDLSGHPKGVYIVQILTNGQRITRKLVLQ